MFSSQSRDLRQRSGASDVISDVIQLSSEARDNGEFAPTTTTTFTTSTRHNDVTYHRQQQQQQQQQQRTGQSSAAVKRRMESSSSSSGVTRKRQRYEYNEVQRRLLCDAYAKRKSLALTKTTVMTFVVQSAQFHTFTRLRLHQARRRSGYYFWIRQMWVCPSVVLSVRRNRFRP